MVVRRQEQMPAAHCLLLLFIFSLSSSIGISNAKNESFGAIVDVTSRAGKEEIVAMKVAINDFYSQLSYQRPTLRVKNSGGDPVRAASSVLVATYFAAATRGQRLEYVEYIIAVEESSLGEDYGRNGWVVKKLRKMVRGNWTIMKNLYLKKHNVKAEIGRFKRFMEIEAKTLINKHGVRALIGLGTYQETVFVADHFSKSQVPILSLANHIPPFASEQWPFLIDAARIQFAQMKAIAAIIQSWEWRKVTIIYEDINQAVTGIIPYLFYAIREIGSDINEFVPLLPFCSHQSISEKLRGLKSPECRVFIVHTSAKLGADIFIEAKKLGMMEKEYVWITTDSITNHVDTLNASVISSMQGVLGIKTYFSHTRKRFKDFHSSFQIKFHMQYPDEPYPEPGIFAFQAYDAVWAVALAMNSSNSIGGRQLLDGILQINFNGLTGAFNFKNRRLAPVKNFQLVNVVGKSYREIGYWTVGQGFSDSIGEDAKYNKSMSILGQVFWPGGPWSVPRGWAVPNTSTKQVLRIGVPGAASFREFVNVSYDGEGGDPIVRGFCIDVFKATVKQLPYDLPYKFVPFNGTYDLLIQQVSLKRFDAVVGDTAIIANRCQLVEFSQPYADAGIQIVVYVKPKLSEKAWLFKRPFTTEMWIFTGVVNVYNGFVVWLIERRHNPQFRGTIWNQVGTMLSLSFTTLFSLQGARLNSNLSRMAMVVWLFIALVITQSFTASLTTLLTADRLVPVKIDAETLRKSGAKVGCNGNSFIVKYLEVVLNFPPNNIKRIFSSDDYAQQLRNGDIAAAFLGVPYVKVFLAKHCNGFTTSGPMYRDGGFGFVFPRDSPYLPDISRGVLKVSESGQLVELENSMVSSYNCSASKPNKDGGSLGMNSFWGLFVITVGASTIALVLFIVNHFRQNDNRNFAQAQQWHAPDITGKE